MLLTRFLEPVSVTHTTPNYANVIAANVSFLDYSLPVAGSLTTAEARTLVRDGVSAAIANASSTFTSDPDFIELFQVSEAQGIGSDDSYISRSRSNTSVAASFDVSGGQALSFDFATGIDIESKEIEDPRTEYSRGHAKTGFLVLDTSGASAEVLGYYGMRGRLESSEKRGIFRGQVRRQARRNLFNLSLSLSRNIDGDDGVDFLVADVSGHYSKTFALDVTEVTLVQVTKSVTVVAGDDLIGNLGDNVIYGTLKKDVLTGSNYGDSIYGSLGNDNIKGKRGDDILEGGAGNDRLYGNAGDDRIHGGNGNDIIRGGRGNDTLAGGDGTDYFFLGRLQAGEIDTILDFEVGTDKLYRLGSSDRTTFFDQIVQTDVGAQYTASTGGQVLLEGVSVDRLRNAAGSLFA